MSALARYCLTQNVSVSGSDKRRGEEARLLKSLGAEISVGHRKNLPIGVDALVYTSAVPITNAEIVDARKKGIPIFKRSEFLGGIVKDFNYSISVCGSHGKTTTTAMLAEIFINAGYNPTVFLGGDGKSFGNFNNGGGEFVILEACEYKKNFLDLKSNAVIVTNIDNDHLDSYSCIEEEISAVGEFIKDSLSFINADDENSKSLHSVTSVTYGIRNNACYQAKNVREWENGQSFTVCAYGRRLGRIKIPLKGIHNVYNALSALAFSIDKKIPFSVIKKSLEKFGGVGRRDEFIGEFNGVKLYTDYAHHPSEIASLISSVKGKEDTMFVFQPHTYSRTKYLMKDFVRVLGDVANLVIFKTYPARENYSKEGCAKRLYKEIKRVNNKVKYCENVDEIMRELENLPNANKVYFVGAGDLYELVLKKYCQK